MGRDPEPAPLDDAEIAGLRDPFSTLVLSPGARPLNLRALLAALDAANAQPHGLPEQKVFLVAEGGQIAWSPETDGLAREFRFLLTRSAPTAEPDLLISASTAIDSDDQFLQVVAWDPAAGAYQFYDRRGGNWIWAGSSWDALDGSSRGQGPFDSHVNGALNMKEMKRPWINWHSQSASITDESLAPTDSLRNEPLWRNRSNGEDFENKVARPGIRRWNRSRVTRCLKDNRLTRLPEFLRQALTTSTVNLVSSSVASDLIAPGVPVDLPLPFFLDSDALVDTIGLDPGIDSIPTVDGAVYLACIQKFDVALVDRAGRFRFPGDTHFPFVVPERAFEDLNVIEELLRLKVLTPKLAAAMLMVDFSNPVFSARRAHLLGYVPESASTGSPSDFIAAFTGAVEHAAPATASNSPEREFLDNWRLPDNAWRADSESRIRAYFSAVLPRLQSLDAFAPLFQLAESRRREFRRRPLAEFRLTTPTTNIPEDAPLLEMTPAGEVRSKE
jgi:hypothetical protein